MSILLLIALVASGSRADEPKGEEASGSGLRIARISPSCYAVVRGGGRSNAGFVVGKRGVLAIDAFDAPEVARDFLEAIRNTTDKPLVALVLTHWHYDHSVGNQVFPEDVPILASEAAAEALRKRLESDRLLLGPATGMHGSVNITRVRPVKEVIATQKEIDLGDLVVRLNVAGNCHSLGDLVVQVPSEKVLFAGDLVWNRLHPIPGGGGTFAWITALAHLERLELEHVVPGHGDPGARGLLADQRRYLMTLRRLVKHLARKGVSFEDIVGKLEVPGEFAGFGNEETWTRNVRFVCSEMAKGS